MTDALKDAIRSAGIERGIIEAGAPVDEKELIAIVKCLGMGPKMDDKSKEMVNEALAKVSELGTIGAMKWLAAALRPCEGESAKPLAWMVESIADSTGQTLKMLKLTEEEALYTHKLFRGSTLTPLYPSPSAERSQDAGWISIDERLPEVPQGGLGRFLVACRRAHNGKTYVFEACYLNAHILLSANDDGEEKPFSGWHQNKEHSEYDDYYESIETAGDVVTHWMPFPPAPGAQTTEGAV